jgi:hypothetical protein
MPVTDRREPAVYVTIEDASVALPTLETGRTVFAATLCDRGPHNRVLTFTNYASFKKTLGQPDFRRTSQAHYILAAALQYTSSVLAIRVMPEDAQWANSNVSIPASNTPTPVTKIATSTPVLVTIPYVVNAVTHHNKGIATDAASLLALQIGSWVYMSSDPSDKALQIVSKDSTALTFTLSEDYSGIGGTTTAAAEGQPAVTLNSVVPYLNSHISAISDAEPFSASTVPEIVWHFYATGAGSYYNDLVIQGVRNLQYEKMYTDADGVPLYNYLFMDIGIYYNNQDGTQSLVEGPWTVSLTRKVPTGSTIKDLSSGQILYIVDIINNNSNLIAAVEGEASEKLIAIGSITETIASKSRLQVMSLLAIKNSTITASGNIAGGGLEFENGTNGTVDPRTGGSSHGTIPMYNSSNNLIVGEYLIGLVAQAYKGQLTSVDGSIEQLPECTYPWYNPDYVVTGGYPPAIQEAGRYLASYRQDCIHLADTGSFINSYTNDIKARNDTLGAGLGVPWNDWTSALYVQYRKMFDIFTGEYIWMSPVYHALTRHLYCDGAYFIAEPVAGIEKGAITDSIELAYKANHTERGDLQDKQLNMVIVEPAGKYILTQLTTWKRMSVLQRLHVAKFVAYMRKVIPTLLKDILQRKATQYWIGQCNYRINNFLTQFLESDNERYSILKTFSVNVVFDDVRSEINAYIDITPIRAIERINVYIITH